MKEIKYEQAKFVSGGFIHVVAGAVAAYYGEKLGIWIYNKYIK